LDFLEDIVVIEVKILDIGNLGTCSSIWIGALEVTSCVVYLSCVYVWCVSVRLFREISLHSRQGDFWGIVFSLKASFFLLQVSKLCYNKNLVKKLNESLAMMSLPVPRKRLWLFPKIQRESTTP
jgi:hypothetical protein